eukprot:Gb_09267 [translate_table: standard]
MTLQLGMKTTVVISSPAMSKEVLKDNDQNFAGRTILQGFTCLSFNENSLVLSQYGPRWRMLRKLCNTQLFNAKRLEALQHLRKDEVFRLVQHIYEESLKSNAVDIGHAVFLTSLNLVGNMICTGNMFDPNSSSAEEFKEIDLFIGGSETNVTTIEWAMTKLIHKLQTMKRAQAEVEKIVGCNSKVEESDTELLPYLQAIVKEALRLHPPVPLLLPHRADASCEIAGFVIPKNSQVIVNAWAIGRDPTSWNDPLEFIPERFLECEREYKGHDFELIPFGAGRRICPGILLASRMLLFILASLLHSFNWSLLDEMRGEELDMSDKFATTQHKAIALNAIPTPCLPSHLYAY